MIEKNFRNHWISQIEEIEMNHMYNYFHIIHPIKPEVDETGQQIIRFFVSCI